jgi:hypothetical protein
LGVPLVQLICNYCTSGKQLRKVWIVVGEKSFCVAERNPKRPPPHYISRSSESASAPGIGS